MINLINASSSLSEPDLQDVQDRFGFTFPADFRELYLASNGGQPVKNRYRDEKGTCILHQFLPIKHAQPRLGSLEISIQRTKIEQLLLPEHLIPFAIDPFGNYYCFSTREVDFGAIFYVQMEGGSVSEENADFIAPSLNSLLAALRTKEELR